MSGGSSSEQLQDELGHMTREDREAILHEAALPVKIPTEHGLALKCDLQLPWNRMRAIRRYKGSCQTGRKKHYPSYNSRWLKKFKIHVKENRGCWSMR